MPAPVFEFRQESLITFKPALTPDDLAQLRDQWDVEDDQQKAFATTHTERLARIWAALTEDPYALDALALVKAQRFQQGSLAARWEAERRRLIIDRVVNAPVPLEASAWCLLELAVRAVLPQLPADDVDVYLGRISANTLVEKFQEYSEFVSEGAEENHLDIDPVDDAGLTHRWLQRTVVVFRDTEDTPLFLPLDEADRAEVARLSRLTAALYAHPVARQLLALDGFFTQFFEPLDWWSDEMNAQAMNDHVPPLQSGGERPGMDEYLRSLIWDRLTPKDQAALEVTAADKFITDWVDDALAVGCTVQVLDFKQV